MPLVCIVAHRWPSGRACDDPHSSRTWSIGTGNFDVDIINDLMSALYPVCMDTKPDAPAICINRIQYSQIATKLLSQHRTRQSNHRIMS